MVCVNCSKELGRRGRAPEGDVEKRRVLRGHDLLLQHLKKCVQLRQAREATVSGQRLAQVPRDQRKK